MSLHWRAVKVLVIAALMPGSQLLASETDTLRGIMGVRVVVENLTTDATNDGLTIDQIQTDVELRLRKAGVKVRGSGFPILYVNAHVLKGRESAESLYFYNCTVNVQQGANISGNDMSALVVTWGVAELGAVGRLYMIKTVRETINDLVDKFLNAYLTVNPK